VTDVRHRPHANGQALYFQGYPGRNQWGGVTDCYVAVTAYQLILGYTMLGYPARAVHLLKEVVMKKLIMHTTIAFALVASTAVLMIVHPQSAVACATWHCGCQEHLGAVACRE